MTPEMLSHGWIHFTPASTPAPEPGPVLTQDIRDGMAAAFALGLPEYYFVTVVDLWLVKWTAYPDGRIVRSSP